MQHPETASLTELVRRGVELSVQGGYNEELNTVKTLVKRFFPNDETDGCIPTEAGTVYRFVRHEYEISADAACVLALKHPEQYPTLVQEEGDILRPTPAFLDRLANGDDPVFAGFREFVTVRSVVSITFAPAVPEEAVHV